METRGKTPDFYTVAKDNGIEIVPYPLPEVSSMSTEVGRQCYIGLDSSRSMTRAEEQSRLGHELGHCLYGGFYSRTSPCDLIERHEARADRWYICTAIPRGRLFKLLREGYDAWDIAEQLDTTEDYVHRAYYMYTEVLREDE